MVAVIATLSQGCQFFSHSAALGIHASHQYLVGKAMGTARDHSLYVVLRCAVSHHPYNVTLYLYCLYCH